MTDPHPAPDWLQTTLQLLTRDGFVVTQNLAVPDGPVRAVARRTRLELSKFGYSETFFVFRKFGSLDTRTLRRFSSSAFDLACRSKTIALPCGIFESVWCFAVAIAEQLDGRVAASVRNDEPTKHWAAGEIPVIFHRTERRIYAFEKTPLWGAAYYAGFRAEIKRYLAHD